MIQQTVPQAGPTENDRRQFQGTLHKMINAGTSVAHPTHRQAIEDILWELRALREERVSLFSY